MKKASLVFSNVFYLFFQGFLFSQPSISINPNSFSSTLYTDDTEVQSMVLSNGGSEPLGWYLSINYTDDNFYRANSFLYRNQEPYLRIEPVMDHEDEDIFIPNNRNVSDRDSRDVDLNIGDVVLNASLNDYTIELYQVNQNGEVSFLYPTEGQALVVEEDGSIVFAVYDIAGECDFTDYYYDQDKNNLQYLKTWGNTWTEYGAPNAQIDWDNFVNFVTTNPMTNQVNYNQAQSLTDSIP